MSKAILIVDDEADIRASLAGVLEDEGFTTLCAASGVEGVAAVRAEAPDLVLLDIWMPGIDGMETLKLLKESFPFLPVVMMSGHGTIETAVKATKMGAYDFIEKPLSLDKILLTVTNALAMSRLREENRSLRSLMAKDQVMVGDSPLMRSFTEQLQLIASSDAPVLITGESGSGKELTARTIHSNSPRKSNPFVELNCAGIPDELIDGELFGHEKGALPGGAARRKGRLDLAEGGTIFLDRIEMLPIRTQAKLVQILRERIFYREGGGQAVRADLRIIAATVKPLDSETCAGRFLDELYYGLSVTRLDMPALSARSEDIPSLVEYFLDLYSRREGKERKKVDEEVMARLTAYSWPGNIRELKNIVERMVIMTPGGTIGVDRLPAFIRETAGQAVAASVAATTPLREARERFEREYITQALDACSWDVSSAAEALAVERAYLFRRIKGYGIGTGSGEAG